MELAQEKSFFAQLFFKKAALMLMLARSYGKSLTKKQKSLILINNSIHPSLSMEYTFAKKQTPCQFLLYF